MEQVISYVFGAIAGVSAIGAIIAKISTASKYLELAKESIELVDEIIKAASDKALTADEIKKIAAEYDAVKEAFKKVRGK